MSESQLDCGCEEATRGLATRLDPAPAASRGRYTYPHTPFDSATFAHFPDLDKTFRVVPCGSVATLREPVLAPVLRHTLFAFVCTA